MLSGHNCIITGGMCGIREDNVILINNMRELRVTSGRLRPASRGGGGLHSLLGSHGSEGRLKT